MRLAGTTETLYPSKASDSLPTASAPQLVAAQDAPVMPKKVVAVGLAAVK